MFCLIVNNFGVEYVGERHTLHLKQALVEHYELTVNWKGDLYSGINLEWNYDPIHSKRTVRLTMDEYIANLRVKYNHPNPSNPQHSPYKHALVIYGAKVQLRLNMTTAPIYMLMVSSLCNPFLARCCSTVGPSTTSFL